MYASGRMMVEGVASNLSVSASRGERGEPHGIVLGHERFDMTTPRPALPVPDCLFPLRYASECEDLLKAVQFGMTPTPAAKYPMGIPSL